MADSGGYELRKRQRQQFLGMAKRYEEMSLQNPKQYQSRMRSFLALGHAYLYGLLILLVALLAVAVWMITSGRARAASFKLALFAAVPAFAIVRSLFFKVPPFPGVRPKPESHPRLHQAVKDLTAQLKAPPVKDLVVDYDLNAFASQRPAWGLVGPPSHIVGLGMPLLLAFDRQQAESILAHELGHIAGGHTRLGARLYRTTRAWWEFVESTENQGVVSWATGGFFRWYMPRLDAMGFALRRIEEYEADAAAKSARDRASGISLIRLSLVRRVEEVYWRSVYGQISVLPEPPTDVFEQLGERLKEPIEKEWAIDIIKKDLGVSTDYDDTHPSLKDRIVALGLIGDTINDDEIEKLAVEASQTPLESAAESLFGDLPGIYAEINKFWRESVAENWKARHIAAKSLEEESQGDTPEAINAAARRAYMIDPASSVPIYERLLTIEQAHPMANLMVGTYRLTHDDPSGLELVERAAKSEQAREYALSYLFNYYERVGDEENAKRVFAEIEQLRQEEEQESEAVKELGANSVYEPAALSSREAAMLMPLLAELKPASAYLIDIELAADKKVRALIVDPGYKAVRLNDEIPEKYDALFSDECDFDSGIFINVLSPQSKSVRAELEKRGIGRIFPAG